MKQKLEITLEKAMELYLKASDEIKEIFHQTFGREVFYKDITERIKTIQNAIEYLGESDIDVIMWRRIVCAGVTGHTVRYLEAVIITKALNELWTPNWDDQNERKWWIWWRMSSSGFGLSVSDYVCWNSSAFVGSRLVFKSKEIAIYAAEQFKEIYREFLTIKK